MDHAQIMNSCGEKLFKLGPEHLTETEQIVALVSIANFEIELGDLDTFYYNSAGNRAVPTVNALESVGAIHAAEALAAANNLFPGGPPTDRSHRFIQLEQLRKLPDKPLEMLGRKVVQDDPDMFALLCMFIDLHADELQGHLTEE